MTVNLPSPPLIPQGTGVRGLAVSFTNGIQPPLVPDGTTLYFLSLAPANPSAANLQALPSLVNVYAHRLGRMFGGAKQLAVLATALPVLTVGSGSSATGRIEFVIPKSLGIDWIGNDVAFQVGARGASCLGACVYPHAPPLPFPPPPSQVVDASPASLDPSVNTTTGTWGRSPYVPMAASSCPAFKGLRATLQAHCAANDMPAGWLPLCAFNCTLCAAAGGTWSLGSQVSYDFVMPQVRRSGDGGEDRQPCEPLPLLPCRAPS